MKSLKQTLSKYAKTTLVLGGESTPQLEQLKSDLNMISKKNKAKVVIRIIILGVIFVVWAGLVWIWRNDAAKISLVFGASGVTVSWLFQKIVELWEEKTASEITVTLVVSMRSDESQSVIQVLASKL